MGTLQVFNDDVRIFESVSAEKQAVIAYLSQYKNPRTRADYQRYLLEFKMWCDAQHLPILTARRPHLGMYLNYVEQMDKSDSAKNARITVVRGFFKLAYADELIDRDPSVAIKPPHIDQEKQKRPFLSPVEFARYLERAAEDPNVNAAALVMLIGMRGLRVAEACSLDVGNIGDEGGLRVLKYVGKGSKTHVQLLPAQAWKIVERCIGEREVGPILLNEWGNRMTRANAAVIVRRIAKDIGSSVHVTPHALRRSFVTAGLALGEDIYSMQQTVGHASSATTARYDRLAGSIHKDRSQSIASRLSALAG